MNCLSQSQFSSSVRENYDRLSRIYDLVSGSTERKFIRQTIQRLNIPERCTCLDIGCGTGTGLLELADKVPSAAKIIGVDLSFGMCQKAKSKMDQAKLKVHPTICRANGFSLPFRTAEFNLVFMSFTFELIPQSLFQPICSEILRVLKPAGIFSTVNMLKSDSRNLIFTMYKWGHAHYPRLIDCRPIDSGTILTSFGFEVNSIQQYNLWGIPVAAISASKKN